MAVLGTLTWNTTVSKGSCPHRCLVMVSPLSLLAPSWGQNQDYCAEDIWSWRHWIAPRSPAQSGSLHQAGRCVIGMFLQLFIHQVSEAECPHSPSPAKALLSSSGWQPSPLLNTEHGLGGPVPSSLSSQRWYVSVEKSWGNMKCLTKALRACLESCLHICSRLSF